MAGLKTIGLACITKLRLWEEVSMRCTFLAITLLGCWHDKDNSLHRTAFLTFVKIGGCPALSRAKTIVIPSSSAPGQAFCEPDQMCSVAGST